MSADYRALCAEMTPLSPAAQAVLDAFEQVKFADRYALAAALVAVAPTMECVQDHLKLLTIAAELDGYPVVFVHEGD
jgi:hypothetical protein